MSSSSTSFPPLDESSTLSRFQSFLRIKTIANEGLVSGANHEAVTFLQKLGAQLGMESQTFEYSKGEPILLLTLKGSDPDSPSILLNSHYDVVPVIREHWKLDPFGAEFDADGFIHARGTQDMKSVCMQYLEAIMRLQAARPSSDQPKPLFRRTVQLSFMPDEETGGSKGMATWTLTKEFQALNVAFALDEGIANPADEYTVFYGERGVWWLTVFSEGPTGHGSRFIKDPATNKLMKSIKHFLDYRDAQEKKLLASHSNHPGECAHAVSAKLQLGDVTTINLTVLQAGVSVDGGKSYSYNVVPMHAKAGFDVRLPPHVPLDEFEAMVKEWTSEDGMSYEIKKFSAEQVVSLDDERNPFWKSFRETLESASGSAKVAPQIFPAGTDSRFLRRAGIPSLGFSPLRNTPILLHDHNERVHKDVYMEGIKIYQQLIPALANLVTNRKREEAVYAAEKQPLDRL